MQDACTLICAAMGHAIRRNFTLLTASAR
jgi:hypothetical protein